VPGKDGVAQIFQDSGDGYVHGDDRPVHVRQSADEIHVSQVPTRGLKLFTDEWAKVKAVELLGLTERQRGALLKGLPPAAQPDFDKGTGRLRIAVPNDPFYTIKLAP
jgi:hypothetical protein